MQLCLKCRAGFPRDEKILAHQIGMHVNWWPDRYTNLNGDPIWFINTMCFK